MSPAKFFTLFTLLVFAVITFLFFKTIPPSVIFHRSPPAALPTAQPANTTQPDNQPYEFSLPASVRAAPGWSTLSLSDQQLQFDYPDVWGTPSASLTRFSAPDSGTLTGIYFVHNDLSDTPVFLEFTSSDYKNTASVSAVFTKTQGNLTNTIRTDGTHFAYYTFATFPHLTVYANLPQIQGNLPDTDMSAYFTDTSARIFSGTGMSASDSANLKNFLKLVASVRPLPTSAPPTLIPPYNLK